MDIDEQVEEGQLQGYEKIRVVGKGAFGLAVLYRRIADGMLVVIKEVNIIELNATERQLALNEVQVLASLDHPNIISYRRSFEREGQLMIEMEYADGGTLSQLLLRRETPLSERAILHLYRQICAALRHMHERGVLHRDLKTANVFLTKKFAVKIGDFGISKVLTTRVQAQTILGTPYYISPEMCEGKQYGPKSDIWASGCILYEMTTLVKAFEASNLPALINKIIKGQFDPIPAIYSKGLAFLVEEILQRDPDLRPSAAQLCEQRLPELIRSANAVHTSGGSHNLQPTLGTLDLTRATPENQMRSILYFWRSHGENFDLIPVPLPPRNKVREVAAGSNHVLVVTEDFTVYSWGDGSRGQLGHDHPETRRGLPACIESLKGKGINKVAAGRNFSVFGSESGMVLTCGDGTAGCLGHGEWVDAARPRIIERLLNVDVTSIACGEQHVVALSSRREIFTWGLGQSGRLGHGNENSCCIPELVVLPPEIVLEGLKIRAGPDNSALISTAGTLYVWGSNAYNKLALDRKGICGFMREVTAICRPNHIPLQEYFVYDVALGRNHTALLTTEGQVLTLGKDHMCSGGMPTLISGISNCVTTLVCGEDYTVACTQDNVVYFWGVRHTYSDTKAINSNSQLFRAGVVDIEKVIKSKEFVSTPQEILALYGASGASPGPSLSLGCISTYGNDGEMLLLLHTTAPCPSLERDPSDQGNNQSPRFRTVRSASNGTQGMIPEWLKAELAAAPDYSNYQQ